MVITLNPILFQLVFLTGFAVWATVAFVLAVHVLARILYGTANSISFHLWWMKADPRCQPGLWMVPSLVVFAFGHCSVKQMYGVHYRTGTGCWYGWNNYKVSGSARGQLAGLRLESRHGS